MDLVGVASKCGFQTKHCDVKSALVGTQGLCRLRASLTSLSCQRHWKTACSDVTFSGVPSWAGRGSPESTSTRNLRMWLRLFGIFGIQLMLDSGSALIQGVVSLKEEERTDTGDRPHEDKAEPSRAGSVWSPQGREEAKKDLPRRLQGVQPHSQFDFKLLASNRERINAYCFRPLSLWGSVTASPGNQHR